MSGKDLFEAMSHVDERFVDEAENNPLSKRAVSAWIKAASMAACLGLIVFSVYTLHPYPQGETEGIAAEGAAELMREDVLEDEKEQVSQEAAVDTPTAESVEEVPSLILYVEDMTETGFIGTVAQLVDTGAFEIGMKLNVVAANETQYETESGNPAMSGDFKTDYSGSYVLVQFIKYDRKTSTIIVNMIQQADAPEQAP